jgi:hypothetical protein
LEERLEDVVEDGDDERMGEGVDEDSLVPVVQLLSAVVARVVVASMDAGSNDDEVDAKASRGIRKGGGEDGAKSTSLHGSKVASGSFMVTGFKKRGA